MSEIDEYDDYSLDLEDILAAEAAAGLSPPPHPSSQTPHLARIDDDDDEYGAYDLSEFSADDFAHIDAAVLAHHRSESVPPSPPSSSSGRPSPGGTGGDTPRSRAGGPGSECRRGAAGRTYGGGGPHVEIRLEEPRQADRSPALKGVPEHLRPRVSATSPYHSFRRWKRVLSVSDLVAPSWCEVQYDYGLRQQRHKKVGDRPASFVTAEGRTITVQKDTAKQNDVRTSRGKSVHAVLEREVVPEKVAVKVTKEEERWALRLVNMLSSLQSLMELGFCREMPVFGIIHDQVVVGIIDEISRKPIPASSPSPPRRSSPNKRAARGSPPSTPRKCRAKKTRSNPSSPAQSQITSFFTGATPSAQSSQETVLPPARNWGAFKRYRLHLSDTKTRVRPSLPPDEDAFASRLQLMLYHRLLTSALHSTPTASDSSDRSGPLPLDFDDFWRRMAVDPDARLSDTFLEQAGLAVPTTDEHGAGTSAQGASLPGSTCLRDLVNAWLHAVEALSVDGVDNTLTIVYRSQNKVKRENPAAKKSRRKGPAQAEAEALSPEEAQDVAAALQGSVSDIEAGAGDELSRAIFESLKDAVLDGRVDKEVLASPFGAALESGNTDGWVDLGTPRGRTESGSDVAADPELAWAIRESLLQSGSDAAPLPDVKIDDELGGTSAVAATNGKSVVEAVFDPVVEPMVVDGHQTEEDVVPADADTALTEGSSTESEFDSMSVKELNKVSAIIGKPTFAMDDAVLDAYLTHVLAWWYGYRSPVGVDVGLTRRCLTCEYKDGCEWREKKAEEAWGLKYADLATVP